MTRDDLLGRLANATPRRSSPVRGRVVAIVLGWLVLMTIWGFGRAWHGDIAPVELTIGLLAGGATTVVAWRRAGRR